RQGRGRRRRRIPRNRSWSLQGEIPGDREGGEQQSHRLIALGVPPFPVQEVDRAQRAAIPYDREVEDRAAAQRGDERVIEEDRSHVGGGGAQGRLLAAEHLLRPRGRVHGLFPPPPHTLRAACGGGR